MDALRVREGGKDTTVEPDGFVEGVVKIVSETAGVRVLVGRRGDAVPGDGVTLASGEEDGGGVSDGHLADGVKDADKEK